MLLQKRSMPCTGKSLLLIRFIPLRISIRISFKLKLLLHRIHTVLFLVARATKIKNLCAEIRHSISLFRQYVRMSLLTLKI